MMLADRVEVARRFRRSVRIDADIATSGALNGFVCPKSSAETLVTIARHVQETEQTAFTWTGPYGSGKSTLAVAMCALLNGNKSLREQAAAAIGTSYAENIWAALPPKRSGWRILPVVGQRSDPTAVISNALVKSGLITNGNRKKWDASLLVDTLTDVATEEPNEYGGLIVFVDEMGKFLEGAALQETDLYLFQLLAEAASRSSNRLIFIGVLHQAFEEYARRLSRQARDEWAKIQGRFIDLIVDTFGEEQIDLLGRAICPISRPTTHKAIATRVSEIVREQRPSVSNAFADRLDTCWPLHPAVACLLGPISRRRFGQNQRSIFGFLNSAEILGFQEFIRHHSVDELYDLHHLWDYLRINLEPAILASPDGHRWALAAEAIERCEARGGDKLHIEVLKSIAIVDLFKERSGLIPSLPLIESCFCDESRDTILNILQDLETWSLVIFRKHLGAYSVYAGSDFDIDHAVEKALNDIGHIDYKVLTKLTGLQPILAKRHYHDTGALRWFDVALSPLHKAADKVSKFEPTKGAIGMFLLALPDRGETPLEAQDVCQQVALTSGPWEIMIGLPNRPELILQLSRELLALESVRLNSVGLSGDAVARKEVHARLAACQAQLESLLQKAFDNAKWYQHDNTPDQLPQDQLSVAASDLADGLFEKSPRIRNELLNRVRPSSNAVAARNILLRQMVTHEGQPRLGIEGFPAEGGLFASLLDDTGLYQQVSDEFRFVPPRYCGQDPCRLSPMWAIAIDHLRKHADRTVDLDEIFEIWTKPPYGVKQGLLAVFGLAFILSQRHVLACYRQGLFLSKLRDIDVDYLAKDPRNIQLRWMDLSDLSKTLLTKMAETVRELDKSQQLINLRPIDVGRGLIAIHDNLHPWTKRTMRLSANAKKVRDLFRKAHDPNKFLFDDIPELFGENKDLNDEGALEVVVKNLHEGLKELIQAYPVSIQRMKELLLSELQVPNSSPMALADLRDRAANAKEVAGDFRVDAFITRLEKFTGTPDNIEELASLAIHKPTRDWRDQDMDRALVELTAQSQRFLRAETFTRVKGRPEKRSAMAVIVGRSGRPTPVLEEFEVSASDKQTAKDLAKKLIRTIRSNSGSKKNVVLAALSEVSALCIEDKVVEREETSLSLLGEEEDSNGTR